MTVIPYVPGPRPRRLDRVTHRLATSGGSVTAEYAVATVAACGFAGVLYKILTSSQVLELVVSLISKALSFIF